MKITLVTGNWAKVAIAKEHLEPEGYEIDNVKMDTVEIQADTLEEVAAYSAKNASDKLKCNVVKNDTGIIIDALNGFPCAYTHYVGDTIGEKGILKLMRGVENRKARFVQVLAYCEYGKEPVVFTSITKGTLATRKSGKYGLRIDPIFISDGYKKTMAHYNDDKRFNTWNTKVFDEIAEYVLKKDK